jgi:S1-C subfamily serine protease
MKLERATTIALAAVIITYVSVLFAVVAYAAGTPMQQAREVVLLLAPIDRLMPMSCSAVVIAPNLALTAKHCVDMPNMTVVRADGGRLPVFSFEVSSTADLAIMHVPGLTCPCAAITSVRAERDEVAYAVGFPHGQLNVLTVGYIQGRITAPDGNSYIVATLDVNPGVSGGGLFVVRGDTAYLVGILVMMWETGNPALAVELVPIFSVDILPFLAIEMDVQ